MVTVAGVGLNGASDARLFSRDRPAGFDAHERLKRFFRVFVDFIRQFFDGLIGTATDWNALPSNSGQG